MRSRVDLFVVASYGGHLEELIELSPAWSGHSCLYLTTAEYRTSDPSAARVELIPDCHRGQILKMLACMVRTFALMLRWRPRCMVTTGALPGLVGAVCAQALGITVIWIDSVANADEPSASGRMARFFADDFVVQWPSVATTFDATYIGSLL